MSWWRAISFFCFFLFLPYFQQNLISVAPSQRESDNFAKSRFNCSRSKYNFIYISIIHKNSTRIMHFLLLSQYTKRRYFSAKQKLKNTHILNTLCGIYVKNMENGCLCSVFLAFVFASVNIQFHSFRFYIPSFSQSLPFLHLHLKGDVICLHLIPNGQFFFLEFHLLAENYLTWGSSTETSRSRQFSSFITATGASVFFLSNLDQYNFLWWLQPKNICRVAKCQTFHTEQNFQTKFCPKNAPKLWQI